MCDLDGRVIGGTMSNLFVLEASGLATPRLDRCGIAGTVRRLVLEEAARFGLTAVERNLRLEDIRRARGLFLTNALIGVWPVRLLGERRYHVRQLPLDFLDWIRTAVHQPDSEV
jgi:4-amino-4-deoxychorismate lyase